MNNLILTALMAGTLAACGTNQINPTSTLTQRKCVAITY